MAARLICWLTCLAARRAVVAMLCIGMVSSLVDIGAHAHPAAQSMHSHGMAVATIDHADSAHHAHHVADASASAATHRHDDGTTDHGNCGDTGSGCASHAHCCWSVLALPSAAPIARPLPHRPGPGGNEHARPSLVLKHYRPPILTL